MSLLRPTETQLPRPTETQLHITVADWLVLNNRRLRCIWWHVDNTHMNPARAKQLKRMGMRAGVPDFDFTHYDTRRAFVEVKRRDGRLNDAQKELRSWFYERGIPYLLVRSDNADFIIHETEIFLIQHAFMI